ncbi:hypothetical protein GEMRC1_002411 [Eukaryota sp. GEM-RC1]
MTLVDLFNDVTLFYVKRALQNDQQIMVFVHSRSDTFKTANFILSSLRMDNHSELIQPPRSKESTFSMRRFKSADLRTLASSGIGVHHAGLLRSDRNIVESMFTAGDMKVLCCTATLAWGVNLPSHWVVVKGTQVYNTSKGGFVDISILDVLQCFGRAGRPGFDSFGEAVLVTENTKVDHYLRNINMTVPIESQMIKRLPEHLNAEISLGTVSSIREAAQWLRYTFLFVRMKRNPLAYGIEWAEVQSDPELYQKRNQGIVDAARRLSECRMIVFNDKAGTFFVTDTGRVASHFYLSCDAIDLLNQKLFNLMDLGDVIGVISSLDDFSQFQVRDDEVPELESLSKNLNFPVESFSTPEGKANVLIQCYISNYRPNSFSLTSDYNYVASNLGRITRGIFELSLKRGFANLTPLLHSLSLSVTKQIWPWASPLRQFSLPNDMVTKIESRCLGIDELFELSNEEISEICRTKGVSSVIRRCLSELPFVDIAAKIMPLTASVSKITVSMAVNFDWGRTHGQSQSYWLIVESEDTSEIVYYEYLTIKKVQSKEMIDCPFVIPVNDPRPSHFTIRLISDFYLGVESHFVIPLHDVNFPETSSHFTPLLPLIPLKISILPEQIQNLNIYKFSYFNPIQTQLFHTCFHTDKNILLGAPTGSGKTLIAELCILRLFNLFGSSFFKFAKVVFIAPLKALVSERINDWKAKFSSIGSVIELTGETSHDFSTISNSSIIIATPEKWDAISRGWRFRKFVSTVGLMIFDEIHTLGSDRGAVTEAVVYRMKKISEEFSRPIRFVALSTHLANVSDLQSWLDIPSSALFNFHPSVRPVPTEVHLQSVPGPRQYCPRMKVMNKPIYSFLCGIPPGKPSIVFVSSRRQTRLTAFDFISFCLSDDTPSRFIGQGEANRSRLQSILDLIEDQHLRDTLQWGIGLHHAGLCKKDKQIVEELFLSGVILLLVSTSTLAYGINTPTFAVVIKGTEFFDAKTSRYAQYPLVDVLQMLGRAGRPGFDTSATALVLVHEPVRFFYKKFLYESFPIESSFGKTFIDHLNAEIVSGNVKVKGDVIDWFQSTMFSRRLPQNPDYYGLESSDQVDDHLSIMIESGLSALQDAKCLTLVNDDGKLILTPTAFGKISCFYYLCYKSISLWMSTLSADFTHTDQLLRLIADSTEFAEVPVRHNEDLLNRELAVSQRFNFNMQLDFSSSHIKTLLLIQSYIDSCPLPISDYYTDMRLVLDNVTRVLNGMIEVVASLGHLFPCLKLINILQSVLGRHWYDKAKLDDNFKFLDRAVVNKLLAISINNLPLLVTFAHENRNRVQQIFKNSDSKNLSTLLKFPLLNVKRVGNSTNTLEISVKVVNYSIRKNQVFEKVRPENLFFIIGQGKSLVKIKKFVLNRDTATFSIKFDELDFNNLASFDLFVMFDSFPQLDYQFNLSKI